MVKDFLKIDFICMKLVISRFFGVTHESSKYDLYIRNQLPQKNL